MKRLLMVALSSALMMSVVATPASANIYDGTLFFSGDGYNSVEAQSRFFAGQRCPELTPSELLVMALAPTWPETGARENTAAPSPMTLGRADRDADLYPGGNGSGAAWSNAYWHAGVGVWQLDFGGTWDDLDTYQRIHIPTASLRVVELMSARFCSATGTDAARRRAAWQGWFGCGSGGAICESIFKAHYRPSDDRPTFIVTSYDVDNDGGLEYHSCTLGNGSDSNNRQFSCPYYNRARVQGYADPWLYGTSSNSNPEPRNFSMPTMDKSGNTRHDIRVWFAEDISGSYDNTAASPGGNPRETGAITWSRSTYMCDKTVRKGNCVPSGAEALVDFVDAIGP